MNVHVPWCGPSSLERRSTTAVAEPGIRPPENHRLGFTKCRLTCNTHRAHKKKESSIAPLGWRSWRVTPPASNSRRNLCLPTVVADRRTPFLLRVRYTSAQKAAGHAFADNSSSLSHKNYLRAYSHHYPYFRLEKTRSVD